MGVVTDFVRGWVQDVLQPVVDARAAQLAERRAQYEGTQYEGKGLRPPWTKVPPGANPGPLRLQRPAVQYDLAKLVVDRPVALLAGEGRFPRFGYRPTQSDADVKPVVEWLNSVAEEGELAHAGLLAARWAGVCGSAAIVWELVGGEVRFEAFLGEHCTPALDPNDPRKVLSLERRYPFTRQENGKSVTWWHRETWDDKEHAVYPPARAEKDGTAPSTWGTPLAVPHGLGFCAAVWLRLVDDPCGGDGADGLPLHHGITDLTEDIDRVLGQKARAVLKNQDPRTIYFGLDQKALDQLNYGGSDLSAPATSQGSSVELVEMTGDGQRVAEEHITSQRDRALETTRVVSPNPDRLLAAARSGAALQVLHGPMLEMVGELRSPYGRAIRQLGQQLLAAAGLAVLQVAGALVTPPPATIPPGRVVLEWGAYFDATPEDLLTAAQTAESLGRGGIDDETVVRWLALRFGWRDAETILERVRDARAEGADLLDKASKSLDAQKETDEPTKPAEGTEAKPTAEPANVQAAAFNGSQVESLQAIVTQVATGIIPSETGAGMIQLCFPTATDAQLAKILGPLKDWKAPPKAPPPGHAPPVPPGKEPDGDELAAPGGDAAPGVKPNE